MSPGRNLLLDGGVDPGGSFTDRLSSVAAAFDFLGDTWAMLIIDDLLRRGPQTAGVLRARNQRLDAVDLDARIEHLRAHGIVDRSDGADPVVSLTRLGRSVEPVLRALARFGAPLERQQSLSSEMLAQLVVEAALDRPHEVDRLDLSAIVALEVSGRTVSVMLAPAVLRAEGGDAGGVDALVRCTQDVFVDVIHGVLPFDVAVSRAEMAVDGDVRAARRLFELLRR